MVRCLFWRLHSLWLMNGCFEPCDLMAGWIYPLPSLRTMLPPEQPGSSHHSWLDQTERVLRSGLQCSDTLSNHSCHPVMHWECSVIDCHHLCHSLLFPSLLSWNSCSLNLTFSLYSASCQLSHHFSLFSPSKIIVQCLALSETQSIIDKSIEFKGINRVAWF